MLKIIILSKSSSFLNFIFSIDKNIDKKMLTQSKSMKI